MPDHLFSPLDEGPVPPMPGAAAARARGDQRRRRGRAALAGAGALTVALALGGGYALVSGGSDALRPPPASPVESPSATPSTAPSTGASSAPSISAPVDVSTLLLTVADAQRVGPGDWSTLEAPTSPLLDPCAGGTEYPRDADRTATASVALQTLRESGGTDVRQTLARYGSAGAAADAAAGYERAVRGCPGAGPDSEAFDVGYQVVRSESDAGTTTVVVRMSQGIIYSSYVAVQQRGDLVSVLAVGYGEDGDPTVEAIEPYLPVVAESLAQD